MVRIRLKRIGAKNDPYFRIVAIDRRKQRDGAELEILGTYNPKAVQPEDKVKLKYDRIEHWLKNGAQASETVKSLMKIAKAPGVPEENTQPAD